jgi:hypothetical protein
LKSVHTSGKVIEFQPDVSNLWCDPLVLLRVGVSDNSTGYVVVDRENELLNFLGSLARVRPHLSLASTCYTNNNSLSISVGEVVLDGVYSSLSVPGSLLGVSLPGVAVHTNNGVVEQGFVVVELHVESTIVPSGVSNAISEVNSI